MKKNKIIPFLVALLSISHLLVAQTNYIISELGCTHNSTFPSSSTSVAYNPTDMVWGKTATTPGKVNEVQEELPFIRTLPMQSCISVSRLMVSC